MSLLVHAESERVFRTRKEGRYEEKVLADPAFEAYAKLYGRDLFGSACAGRSNSAGSVTTSDLSSSEDSSRSTRFARGPHCPLSRSAAGTDVGRFHLSPRNHAASAVAREEQELEGPSAR